MNLDSGIPLHDLLVDGGMTVNDFLMQLQSNILGINVGKSRSMLLFSFVLNEKICFPEEFNILSRSWFFSLP